VTADIHKDSSLAGRGIKIGLAFGAVAAMWSVSSYGYYALVNAMGLQSGYNDAPFLFAAYYVVWAGIALFWFRDVLAVQLDARELAFRALAILAILCAFILTVVVYLPALPTIAFWRAPADPPEFMFASGWYYLPKSADILFQQALIASMIWTASRLGYRLVAISFGMALLFGGFHLMLAFEGFTLFYVARFAVAATVFGAIAPYLYLRVKSGYLWAYALHWSFYVFDKTLTSYLLAAPAWTRGWL